ncbi:MAG: hypothetical protein ACTSXY_12345 [Promethearchaeota archaeon]
MFINDLYPVILIIATVAILLGIIMMIMVAWQGITNNEIGIVQNETITPAELIAGSGSVNVDGTSNCSADTFLISYVTNATGGDTPLVGDGNYTFTTTGIFSNLTPDYDLDGGFNISYTYHYGGADCDAVGDIISDFTNFVPWIGIILLVIAAAIVLGIVISSFKKPRI